MSLGSGAWQEVRAVLTELLSADNAAVRDDSALRSKVLIAMVSPNKAFGVVCHAYTSQQETIVCKRLY